MSYGRRSSDRRRRVLYTTHHADTSPMTAASRREAERMREARRPTAAYGIRVKRRLRGRWFSLVPVRRRALYSMTAAIVSISLLLCLLHYAAVAWPAIAYQEEIARPLRLDLPESFGRYLLIALTAGSAGASLMIYQLRRYRIDDYQGHYRLWRLVLVVLLLVSVESLVSLMRWSGALIDAGFGQRVALSGVDWVRLVVTIGGAILALRLIAEVRRSRWSLVSLLICCSLLALSEAAKWKFVSVESVPMWVLVTSAPLLAFTALFVSLGGYLRILYREVRQIEDSESIGERMQQFKVKLFQRDAGDEEEEAESEPLSEPDQPYDELAPRPKQRWWKKDRSEKDSGDEESEIEEEEEEFEPEEEVARDDEPDADQETKPKSRRRWFGLRKAKPNADAETDADDEQSESDSERNESASDEPDEPPAKKKKKRRRFSLRLDPANVAESEKDDEPAAEAEPKSKDDEEDEGDAKPKKKRGLGGWFRSKKSDPANEDESESNSADETAQTPPQETDDESSEDSIDPDDIDWDSMSKSERRRLRKKLRRQGRAA